MRKGIVFEMLGFVILAIAIIGVIIFLRTYLVGPYGRSFITVSERHELEGFKAGANSVLKTTEPRSGKTIEELIGIAAYVGNTTVDFGPGVGVIDVKKELEWRFNALYGKGHWYLKVPFPEVIPDIQVVIVTDVSGSMCDDILDIRENIPKILEELKLAGRNTYITLYLLPGFAYCVIDGETTVLTCNDFVETENFHCRTIESARCDLGGQTEEDWGNGLKCAIEEGPVEGWKDFSVKIGIPSSDELPGGSECGGSGDCSLGECTSQRRYFENGLNSALENKIKIFPLRAYPCGVICYPQSGCTDLRTHMGGLYCNCGNGLLKDWMEEMAEKTGGKMFELKEGSKAADAIKDVIIEQHPDRIPNLEAGTTIPVIKNVRAVTNPIPVSLAGKYTKIYLYQWS